ncbi:hypothetical protein Tco_1496858, partial [Tanacetum coccineum]
AKTINGEVQLHALVDGKKLIITESTVRRYLQLEDAEGVDYLPNSTIFEQLTLMGLKTTSWNEFSNEAVHKVLGDSLVRAATTASSLKAEQDSGNINKTQSKATPIESSSLGTTLGGGPRCQETIGDTIPQTRVKKLEKKDRSRTYRLKRLYKVGLTVRVESSDNEESLGEDVSKQGRIDAIDTDEEITLVSVYDMNVSAVSAAGDIVSTASAAKTVSAATITTATIKTIDDITLAQALKEIKSTKPKKKRVVIQELGESTTTISL